MRDRNAGALDGAGHHAGRPSSLSLLLLALFNWETAGRAYSYRATAVVQRRGAAGEAATWIRAFNIEYFVGIDGLSLPLVLLSTFICVLACIASWNIEKMTKGYFALFLFLETGILGVFLSLDFFLFYVFFEISLLPMYFLIGIWGGPRKEYAAIKFFLYTLVGSIGLLIVLIGMYLYTQQTTGVGSFDLIKLASRGMQAALASNPTFCYTAGPIFFLLAMVGFLIKVPAVPFHTWLPDAHVEAPTPISHDPGRHPAEDGRLRHLPDRLSAVPRCGQALVAAGRDHRRGEHHLRRAVRHGADRLQEARGLLLRVAHGLRGRWARR